MKTKMMFAGLLFAAFGMAGTAAAECVVSYERTACKGQEAISYKKCGGNKTCDKVKEAANEAACLAKALKSCNNSRLDITKYKKITAAYNGKALTGGFNATGQVDAHGSNFCAADRPDLNQCE